MTSFIYGLGTKEGILAMYGPYSGDHTIEAMVADEEMHEWGGRACRHFVPIEYYREFMNDHSLYDDLYGDYEAFVFIENNDQKEGWPLYIDEHTIIYGEWILGLWKDGLKTFPDDDNARVFFRWLTSRPIQELIHAKGTEARITPSTQLI
jgi:hypothetical protein